MVFVTVLRDMSRNLAKSKLRWSDRTAPAGFLSGDILTTTGYCPLRRPAVHIHYNPYSLKQTIQHYTHEASTNQVSPTKSPQIDRVTYDANIHALMLHDFQITDQRVVNEARRWAKRLQKDTGTESGSYLADYVKHALIVGTMAIQAADGVQQSATLQELIKDLGDRTERSVTMASRTTTEALATACSTLVAASDHARNVIDEAARQARDGFSRDVRDARMQLESEVNRLVGGKSSVVMERLQPVLESFGRDVENRSTAQLEELMTRVASKFDPHDPTSPMGKQQKLLQDWRNDLREDVAYTLREIHNTLRDVVVQTQSERATDKLKNSTPLKGFTYEQKCAEKLEEIATSLGDEYLMGRDLKNLLPRCKKGDGVFLISGGVVKLVVEMHDGAGSRSWTNYLSEAERNRGAVASLGLVRTIKANRGEMLRVLGPRRLVLAFDPGSNETSMLRSTILLLRVMALSSASHQSSTINLIQVHQWLSEATATLEALADIQKSAKVMYQHAETIEKSATSLNTKLLTLLTQAIKNLKGGDVDDAPSDWETQRDEDGENAKDEVLE